MSTSKLTEFKEHNILHGDALKVLKTFPDGVFDGIITDPPYSSGGATIAEKQQGTAIKYTSTKRNCTIPNFEGDTKDQRSWRNWMSEILYEAKRTAKDSAILCVFTDWRQLPTLTDAIQWGGWVWRGIAVWDKGNSRPQKGRFRQQAEFVVWASKGALPINRPVPCLPGVFRHTTLLTNNRIHQTQKPLELMREIVKIVEPGGVILDPFCGSGTTIEAAKMEGYRGVGVEIMDKFAEAAKARVNAAILR